jgi:hypothetical protein
VSKYHSRKITQDGKTFDSVKEFRRFNELALLEKAGAIKNLETQVKYVLLPAQYAEIYDKKSKRWKEKCIERECAYVADFVYEENGEKVVEDTKGFKTKDYIIKRKLMYYIHGVRIREV